MVERRKDVAASLEYIEEPSGGFGIFKPVVSLVQGFFGHGPTAEKTWQQQIRHYDLTNTGILGNSLDTISYTAGTAKTQYVDPTTLEPIKDPILQQTLLNDIWDAKDLVEAVETGVRSLAQVGEIDLVLLPNGKYELFQVSQRIKSTKKGYGKAKKRMPDEDTITYRYRNSDDTTDTVTVPKSHVERCFVPQPGGNHEAYAPARRVLPWLDLYSQLLRMMQRIAYSNSLMTKGVWLGPDNGDWERDEKYMSQFPDTSKSMPPIVNDLVQLANEIKSSATLNPFWPMMSDTEPVVVDMTTSLDEIALQAFATCNREIALGLNYPAKRLLDDDTTHFTKWAEDKEFQEITVGPLLRIFLKFLDKHIYSKYSGAYGIPAKLSYTFDNLGGSALNSAQLIELFKIRAIGSRGIQRVLGLSDIDTYISPEDDQIRRELLTGDSGLQQAQLSARDQQKFGQQAVATPDSTPVTNGNMRQGNETKADTKPKQVAAALEDVKKKN